MPACGAQSVPARLNRLTNDDDAWEARTLMPGGPELPHPCTLWCLHSATLHWLVPKGVLACDNPWIGLCQRVHSQSQRVQGLCMRSYAQEGHAAELCLCVWCNAYLGCAVQV